LTVQSSLRKPVTCLVKRRSLPCGFQVCSTQGKAAPIARGECMSIGRDFRTDTTRRLTDQIIPPGDSRALVASLGILPLKYDNETKTHTDGAGDFDFRERPAAGAILAFGRPEFLRVLSIGGQSASGEGWPRDWCHKSVATVDAGRDGGRRPVFR
jgi:hypothetical protein